MYTIEKEAGVVGNLLGKNISKAERELRGAKGALNRQMDSLAGTTKTKGHVFKRQVPLTEQDVYKRTDAARKYVRELQDKVQDEGHKTFNTRVGAMGAVGVGAGVKNQIDNMEPSSPVLPNYNENYEAPNYRYITASELSNFIEKEAAVSAKNIVRKIIGTDKFQNPYNFSPAGNIAKKIGDTATFGGTRRAIKSEQFASKRGASMPSVPDDIAERLTNLKKNLTTQKIQGQQIKRNDATLQKIKDVKYFGDKQPHEIYKSERDFDDVRKGYGEQRDRIKNLENKGKDLNHAYSDTKSRTEPEIKEIRRARDNETAKSLGLYGAGTGIGFGLKKIHDNRKEK